MLVVKETMSVYSRLHFMAESLTEKQNNMKNKLQKTKTVQNTFCDKVMGDCTEKMRYLFCRKKFSLVLGMEFTNGCKKSSVGQLFKIRDRKNYL